MSISALWQHKIRRLGNNRMFNILGLYILGLIHIPYLSIRCAIHLSFFPCFSIISELSKCLIEFLTTFLLCVVFMNIGSKGLGIPTSLYVLYTYAIMNSCVVKSRSSINTRMIVTMEKYKTNCWIVVVLF